MSRHHRGAPLRATTSGRHELGQNFLVDIAVIDHVVRLVADTVGPIVEIGSGAGALTIALQPLHRPTTAIEIDESFVVQLRGTVDRRWITVVHADFLRYRLPGAPHVVVGNLPFHQTTAILRRLLRAPGWTDAVLLAQWEVARRRAGVGGATMMTAQWWPWFEFALVRKVPARAFHPRPTVDGGLFTMRRRPAPLVDDADGQNYRAWVHGVFTGRGKGVRDIVSRGLDPVVRHTIRSWCDERDLTSSLPRDLTADQWVELFRVVRQAPGRSTRDG